MAQRKSKPLGKLRFTKKDGTFAFVGIWKSGETVSLVRRLENGIYDERLVFPSLPEDPDTWASEAAFTWNDLDSSAYQFEPEKLL